MRFTLTVITFFIILLVGCGSKNSEIVNQFDSDGKFLYEEEMMISWCEHNKDKDFAKEQCAEFWDEESE